MDARAPAVVALMVAEDPGPWFEETLASLASQDYAELSVLVMAGSGSNAPRHAASAPGDVAARVAGVLPDAFVRQRRAPGGFGEAIDEALPLVQGAAFFLLCHDDVALEPDAVHLMVEEAFRSNAAVVTPKMFRWDQPDRLLHVGMGADRYGAPVDRVQEDEVDHGQHDGVREVFAAPGGCTLVRSDLFEQLGGFDAGITAMGEDLDLSWRVRVAGARVVLAPHARCRHVEAMAHGHRPLPPAPGRQPTRLELERRHEVRTLLKCSSLPTLLVLLPRLVVLTLGEVAAAAAAGDGGRVRAVVGAWVWNLRRLRELRTLHADLARQRHVPDREVHRLQGRGSSRLAGFLSRLEHSGVDVIRMRRDETVPPALTGTVGHAFSEDGDFDELDDLGHRADPGRRVRTFLGTSKARLTAWILVTLFLLIGTRQLVTGSFPLVGQFVPFPSWTATWHQFVSGWQSAGVGSGDPATPAYAVLGALGTVLFGGMGLAQKVLVLGCIPVGAWGMVRFLRPLCSRRARLIGGVAYLGVALPYDALARGRWDGLLAYAAVPWMLQRLARAEVMERAGAHARRPVLRDVLVLGIIDAVAISFVPALGVVLLICAIGLWAGGWLVGRREAGSRVLVVAGGATVVALVLCLPWTIGVLASGRGAIGVFGATSGPWSAPSFGALLRFDVGPVGGSPLSWLIPVAATAPLVLGARDRLAWAGRLWTVACVSWILSWLVVRGLIGSFSPDVDVLLAPAAAAVAGSVGLGFAALENDLSGFQFGWRQLVSVGAVAALAVGLLPVVVEAGDGQWGLPATGYAQSLAWMSAQDVRGGFRVLWLGDPRVVPGSSWRVEPGLAFATTSGGTPGGQDLFAPAAPGAASSLSASIELAMEGRTSTVGQLLAAAAVRYIVVAEDVAPQVAGGVTTAGYALPGPLLSALDRQVDLTPVPTTGGYEVFQNTSFVPSRVQLTHGLPVGVLGAGTSASSYRGLVRRGNLHVASAPAGAWRLTVAGTAVAAGTSRNWSAVFPRVPSGAAVLRVDTGPLVPLGVSVEILLWLAASAVITGAVPAVRRRWRPGRPTGGPAAEPALHTPSDPTTVAP